MKILTGTLSQLKQQVDIRRTAVAQNTDVQTIVQAIIAKVRAEGDSALRTYSNKLDHVTVNDFQVDQALIDVAPAQLPAKLLKALQLAKANITSYHQNEIERGFVDTPNPGIIRGQKITPLAAVGLYVPGGTAAYPSTILMTAIPAKLAGVKKIVMVTPPQPDGLNPVVLAAANLAGVDAIYQVGGAQAIAALAYGTESIPRVDKIMGPGNRYVAEAKKQVFGNVAARAMMVTTSEKLASAVSEQIDIQLPTLPRESIARAAIENQGFIAIVATINDAFSLMNTIAPEHLEVQLPDPITYLAQIQNAGSVFLGQNAAEPVGDYVAGPNHVLPTAGSARFFSPLGVYDFVKRTQFIQYSSEALASQADAVVTLAQAEGLDGHAEAIIKRVPAAKEV
ncbi:MAG: histidinol dehydrogenase [Lacticaseibacillus paracasei]|nr:histidinol dehydrogenase [Lacticaseibacillus paracasei]